MQPELPADRIRQAVVMLSAPRALLVSRETPPERPKASFWALAYSRPNTLCARLSSAAKQAALRQREFFTELIKLVHL